MKKTIILYLVFLLASSTAFAQQNVVTLSDTLYDTSKVVFSGQSLDGWLFKLGNDNSWSAQELDVTNWQALKPEELKPELADENGRLEGWFRIKIKFDAEFNPIPTAIKSGVFGASTVFINGKNIHSFGKTGNDASDFIENKAYQSDIMPFQFEKDSIYTIAIHYVDYVTHFPIKKLKSNGQDANDIILFVTSNYKEKRITDYYNIYLRVGILTAIPFSFAILFWLIFLLNPFEKNIRNFAVALTLFSIIPIFLMLSTLAGNSYTQYKLFSIINNTSAVIFVCYVPILLGSVFERHIHKILIAILVLICFGNILLTFTTSYPDHLIFLLMSFRFATTLD